jgi:hypothetical protein
MKIKKCTKHKIELTFDGYGRWGKHYYCIECAREAKPIIKKPNSDTVDGY